MHEVRFTISSQQHPEKPALSLILCSRNDRYQGDSVWRLQTALNYVAKNVAALGKEADVEVIVADWGSKTPLFETLELTPEAARITLFMLVPPQVALLEQKDSLFPEVLALNAAVRRANGQYIGRIDQDILVGRRFLNTFFEFYERKRLLAVPLESAIMLSNRRRIPYRLAVQRPSFWAVDHFISWFGQNLPLMDPPPDDLYYQSYIGILLFHRNLWIECGGYDQRFIYMDFMEFDLILRLMMKYPFINLGKIVDHDFYHLDHGNPREVWGASRNRRSNPKRDQDNPPEVFHPNGELWGLVEYPLDVVCYPSHRDGLREAHSEKYLGDGLSFVFLLILTGVQMVWDRIYLIALIPMMRFISRLLNPTKIAWETFHGQPVARWPGEFKNLWAKFHSRLGRKK